MHSESESQRQARVNLNERRGAVSVPSPNTRVERRSYDGGGSVSRDVITSDGARSEAQYEAEAPARAQQAKAELEAQQALQVQEQRRAELKREQLASGRFVAVDNEVVTRKEAPWRIIDKIRNFATERTAANERESARVNLSGDGLMTPRPPTRPSFAEERLGLSLAYPQDRIRASRISSEAAQTLQKGRVEAEVYGLSPVYRGAYPKTTTVKEEAYKMSLPKGERDAAGFSATQSISKFLDLQQQRAVKQEQKIIAGEAKPTVFGIGSEEIKLRSAKLVSPVTYGLAGTVDAALQLSRDPQGKEAVKNVKLLATDKEARAQFSAANKVDAAVPGSREEKTGEIATLFSFVAIPRSAGVVNKFLRERAVNKALREFEQASTFRTSRSVMQVDTGNLANVVTKAGSVGKPLAVVRDVTAVEGGVKIAGKEYKILGLGVRNTGVNPENVIASKTQTGVSLVTQEGSIAARSTQVTTGTGTAQRTTSKVASVGFETRQVIEARKGYNELAKASKATRTRFVNVIEATRKGETAALSTTFGKGLKPFDTAFVLSRSRVVSTLMEADTGVKTQRIVGYAAGGAGGGGVKSITRLQNAYRLEGSVRDLISRRQGLIRGGYSSLIPKSVTSMLRSKAGSIKSGGSLLEKPKVKSVVSGRYARVPPPEAQLSMQARSLITQLAMQKQKPFKTFRIPVGVAAAVISKEQVKFSPTFKTSALTLQSQTTTQGKGFQLQRSATLPQQTPAFRQSSINRQSFQLKSVVVPRTVTFLVPRVPLLPQTPFFQTGSGGGGSGIGIPFAFPRGGFGTGKGETNRGMFRSNVYVSDFTSAAFGIYGKPNKKLVKTGFGARPLQRGKQKK